MTDRIIELMATPAPDLIAQINVPTSLQTNGTLKPRALATEPYVPAQQDEHSVERNAGAFPANFDRADRARATPVLPFQLGDRALDERTAPREHANVDARDALDDAIAGEIGGVIAVEQSECAGHNGETNAPRRFRSSHTHLPPSTPITPATVMTGGSDPLHGGGRDPA
jgi:hypothetical protein